MNCVVPQCPVNNVTWCPHKSDLFLSCATDWSIHLWQRNNLSPVLSFRNTHSPVCDVQWSLQRATVFAAITEAQLEIWDLSHSM